MSRVLVWNSFPGAKQKTGMPMKIVEPVAISSRWGEERQPSLGVVE